MPIDISQLPVSFIQTLLLTNPDVTTLSLGGADVARTVAQGLVDSRPLPTTVHARPERPIVGLHSIGGKNKNLD